MKLEHFLTPYTKINSKWFKDLNVRPETIKLLEENIGRALNDINQSKILYDPHPRVKEIKTKVNKWDPIKLKSFWTAKETLSKVKRQPSEWKKNNSKWNNWQRINFQSIQAAHTTQYQKNQQPIQKVGKRSKQTFLQRRHTDGQHMNRCSTSFITKEMQIKTTMRYHLIPVRMAIIKNSTNNKRWRGCGEKGTLLHFWWEFELIQPLWKMVWRFL